MTTRESVRNALEAAHSFIQEEMTVPRVPEDGDFKNRDRHMMRYVMVIDTVEHALRRLDSEMDPEKETLLVGECRDDPSPCPCCGGKAVAETGDGRYGWAWNEWFEYDEEDVSPKRWGSGNGVDYPLYSSYGVRLVMPKDRSYFDEPVTMTVGDLSSGRIHVMPMPEKGHGSLGIVECGEEVTVLAEQDGFYFFQTEDGRRGWNGSRWFED